MTSQHPSTDDVVLLAKEKNEAPLSPSASPDYSPLSAAPLSQPSVIEDDHTFLTTLLDPLGGSLFTSASAASDDWQVVNTLSSQENQEAQSILLNQETAQAIAAASDGAEGDDDDKTSNITNTSINANGMDVSTKSKDEEQREQDEGDIIRTTNGSDIPSPKVGEPSSSQSQAQEREERLADNSAGNDEEEHDETATGMQESKTNMQDAGVVPVENSATTSNTNTFVLKASYQEVAAARRQKELAERRQAEEQAQAERQSQEAERLNSIARLEEERQQRKLEEEQKAQQELLEEQKQRHAQETERLGSIARLEEERRQRRLEEHRKAQQELLEQQKRQPQLQQPPMPSQPILNPESSSSQQPPASSRTMIVLVSNSFGAPAQKVNQDRAIQMLKGRSLPFEEVDGSDPAFKERRNELFGISGVRGKYPQFFVQDAATTAGEPKTSYLGDFETFEGMNEMGSLEQILGCGGGGGGAAAIAIDSSVEAAAARSPVKEIESVGSSTNTDTKVMMIALVSKSFGTLAQKTNQDRAIQMLTGRNIPFNVVDGSDPTMKDKRNELFGISGIRGQYPQFFVQNISDETTSYWGDFETLQGMNEAGDLSLTALSASSKDEPIIEDQNAEPDSIILNVNSLNTLPSSEVWENEFEVSSTPKPERLHVRANTDDSEIMPGEMFENEFDDQLSPKPARFSKPPPPPISTTSRRRLASEDSRRIPSETFENEFDPTTKAAIERLVIETFENEFDPVGEEGEAEQQEEVNRKNKSRYLRTDTSPAESNSFDEDEESPSHFPAAAAAATSIYIHIAIGALGVAAAAGIWWRNSQRRP